MNEKEFLDLVGQTADVMQQKESLRMAYQNAESDGEKRKLYADMKSLIDNDPRRAAIAKMRGEKEPISVDRMEAIDTVLVPLWKTDNEKSMLAKVGGTALNTVNDTLLSIPEKVANVAMATGSAVFGDGFDYAERERNTRAMLQENNPNPMLTFGLSVVASLATGSAITKGIGQGATLLAAKAGSSGVKLPQIARSIAAMGSRTNKWFDTYTATDGFIPKIGAALSYTAKQGVKNSGFGAVLSAFAGPVAQGWETLSDNALTGALFGGAIGTATGFGKGANMSFKNSDPTKTMNMLPKPGDKLSPEQQMVIMQRLTPEGEAGNILSSYISSHPEADMRHMINSLASGQAIAAKNGYANVSPELVSAAQKAVGNIESLGGYGSKIANDRANQSVAALDTEGQAYKSSIDAQYADGSTPTTRIASAIKDKVNYLQDFYRKAIKEPLSTHLSTEHRETRVDVVTGLLDSLGKDTDLNMAVADIPGFSSLRGKMADILGPSKKWKAEQKIQLSSSVADDRPAIFLSEGDVAPTKIGKIASEVGDLKTSARESVADSPKSIVDDIPTNISIREWVNEAKTRLQGERPYQTPMPELIKEKGVAGYRNQSKSETGYAGDGDPTPLSLTEMKRGTSVEPNVSDTPISLADIDALRMAARISIGQIAPRSFKAISRTLNEIVDNNFAPDAITAWGKNASVYADKLGDAINNAIELQKAPGTSVENAAVVGSVGYKDTGASKLVKPGTGADQAESLIVGRLPQTKEIIDSLSKSLDYVESEIRANPSLAEIPLENGGTLGGMLGVQRANAAASRQLADSISLGAGRRSGKLSDSFDYYTKSPDVSALENKDLSAGAQRLQNLIFGNKNPLPMSTTENALNPQRRQLSQDVADSFGAANVTALPIPGVGAWQALYRLAGREVSATGNPKIAEAGARLPEYISSALDSSTPQTRLDLANILGGGKPLPEPTRAIVSPPTAPTLAPLAPMAISRARNPEPSIVAGNHGVAHMADGGMVLLRRAAKGDRWEIVDSFTKQQIEQGGQ